MSAAIVYLRSYQLTMCQQRHDVPGLRFRRMTTVYAIGNHVPRHSDTDNDGSKNIQMAGENVENERRVEELENSRELLENYTDTLPSHTGRMEGTEVVDMLLPSVNMYTNIEDMLTG